MNVKQPPRRRKGAYQCLMPISNSCPSWTSHFLTALTVKFTSRLNATKEYGGWRVNDSSVMRKARHSSPSLLIKAGDFHNLCLPVLWRRAYLSTLLQVRKISRGIFETKKGKEKSFNGSQATTNKKKHLKVFPTTKHLKTMMLPTSEVLFPFKTTTMDLTATIWIPRRMSLTMSGITCGSVVDH